MMDKKQETEGACGAALVFACSGAADVGERMSL
jgi:uncharacterized metal-binding protein